MKKLNIIQSILLFLFGIICLCTIETCYYDYIYSEQKVLLRLSDEFNKKSQDYISFFDYAQNLKTSINWDTIELKLEEVKYETDQEIHINFNFYSDSGGGIGYDGGRGGFIYIPDWNSQIEENLISESVKPIGLSISQLDSLRNHLTELKESEFVLYKDGSVIIKKSIGRELFDRQEYQIIKTGERMFLYGDYWNMLYGNIYVGRKS